MHRALAAICALLVVACSEEAGPSTPGSTPGASTGSAVAPSTAAASGSGALSTASSAASAATSAFAPATDAQPIHAVFLRYKDAILQRKGEAAANAVSDKTLAYFESMRVAALHMPAAEVKRSSVIDRMVILSIRARIGRERLERWHGRELFVYSVDQGWVGEEVGRVEPAEVTIDGDTASLGVRSGASTLSPAEGYRVFREAGTWKLDVMSVVRPDSASVKAAQDSLQKIDPDPNRALEKVVSQLAGKPVGAEIWEPLVPSAPNKK
jgi:hypothetical protein